VVKDYERSFIGAFSSALIDLLPPENEEFELYFTIAKFVNNMGYSLTQNAEFGTELSEKIQNENLSEVEIERELTRQREILKVGAIPEFV
jgi:hypothetical protein